MAFIDLKFRSDSLLRAVSVNVIIPESAKKPNALEYKTLYLLHGLSDDNTAWTRKTSIERYAADYGVAVVMPNCDRSWYTDSADDAKYFTFITEELPSVCRNFFKGMSDKREDNMIAGLSMGGYGALKAALVHPEKFAKCASLSGALDIADLERKFNLNEWRGIFGFDINTAADLKDTKHDLFALAEKYRNSTVDLPEIFMWCGLDDRLSDANRRFDSLLTDLGVSHTYLESEGDHKWKWWDLHIQDVLEFMFGNK